ACYGGKRGQQAGESAGGPRRFVNRFRGRSGAGSEPVHGLAPQNLSPDKHVDVCVDSDEDRGSIPLASIFIGKIAFRKGQLTTGLTTRPKLCANVVKTAIPAGVCSLLQQTLSCFQARMAFVLRTVADAR